MKYFFALIFSAFVATCSPAFARDRNLSYSIHAQLGAMRRAQAKKLA
jgi:hypothetical protein